MSRLKIPFSLFTILFTGIIAGYAQPSFPFEPGSCLTYEQPQTILENDLATLDWQPNGNLTLKLKEAYGNEILWQSYTQHRGKSLCLLDEGNLLIVADKITFAKPVAIDLKPGQCLTSGQTLASNETVSLNWQDDGNLVLYQIPKKSKKKRYRAVWATNTWTKDEGNSKRKLCFDENGSLRIVDNQNNTIWSSKTENKGSSLELGPNCNLRILDTGNRPIWKSTLWPAFRANKVCNLQKKNLWQALQSKKTSSHEGGHIPHPLQKLHLSGCLLSLGEVQQNTWHSATKNCIPDTTKPYSKNSMNFDIDRFYEHAKLIYNLNGEETSQYHLNSKAKNHIVPYMRLFNGQKFSFDYLQLTNRSANNFDREQTTHVKPSSIEYRGIWKLCKETDFKGECIQIKSKDVARIGNIADEFGEEWNDAIASAKLIGYIDQKSGYQIRARFSDTRKICVSTNVKENNTFRFRLTNADNKLFYNSGGKSSECTIEFSESNPNKCCDTGYDGTDRPYYLSWQKNNPVSDNHILSVKITSDEKLQQGITAEEAMEEIRLTEELLTKGQTKICISNVQSGQCENPQGNTEK